MTLQVHQVTEPAAQTVTAVDPDNLRLRCDPAALGVTSSGALTPVHLVPGQGRATEALDFGLAMRQPGYNVFVMGEPGTGRHVTVSQMLNQVAATQPVPPDLCYVHNFDDVFSPRLLSVPAGVASRLRSDMAALLRAIGPAVDAALGAENYTGRVEALEAANKTREDAALRDLGHASESEGLSLLRTAEGFVFAPVQQGRPLEPEAYDALDDAEKAQIERKVAEFTAQLQTLLETFPQWRAELQAGIDRSTRDALSPAVDNLLKPLMAAYAGLENVLAFLRAVRDDLVVRGEEWVEGVPGADDGEEDEVALRYHRYQVNVLVDHSGQTGAPVVFEDNPGFGHLIGRIEHVSRLGGTISNFNLIRAGALHQANGGYLVLDANRLFAQPYAWEGLKRALRSREIRIEPPAESQSWSGAVTLSPEPIPCDLKVVLVGDRDSFHMLHEFDGDFPDLFKVVADFDDDMPRNAENEQHYVRLLTALAQGAVLMPLTADALARMVEEGARLAEDAHRLSLQTRVLADLLREADYHARRAGADTIDAEHVTAALAARRRRFDRYPGNVLESMLDGTVLIATEGRRVGQINALVVIELAGERFGQPARITATARVGEGDVVDIERETELGGAIHSKGVFILSAFLASRFSRHQPLSLNASLVFEQSYAPVEGDSASLAELCALMSALADVPISQALGVTGSVNQFGTVQAIGGVNEKIEGFFDLCVARGLTGEQGVVIPKANMRHLMLRPDVVEAARAGRFSVYAVETADQALSILTGMPAGVPDIKGVIPVQTINHRVATALARMSATHHGEGSERSRRHHHLARIRS